MSNDIANYTNVNQHNYRQYLTTHGEERFNGYMDAIKEITELLEKIHSSQISTNCFKANSSMFIKNSISSLIFENRKFLNSIEK